MFTEILHQVLSYGLLKVDHILKISCNAIDYGIYCNVILVSHLLCKFIHLMKTRFELWFDSLLA